MTTEKYFKKRHWLEQEKRFLFENLQTKSISEIATALGRNERSVKLYLHRHRSSAKSVVKDNVMLRILLFKFENPELFVPNRQFYNSVQIKQRRYWQLYKGIEPMTSDEARRITSYFKLNAEDFISILQLELF